MPHATFSTSMLNSAMPGLSKLAQSLGGGNMAYQAGQDQEMTLQSKLAQAMAQIEASRAQAAHANAQAAVETTKNGMLTGRPALVDELAAGGAGTDVPMVQAIRRFTQTGQRPQVPMGPPTEEGQMGVGSQQFDPAVQSRVVQQLARLAPVLMGAGDVKVDDWAKAQGAYGDQDLRDSVVRGEQTPARVGAAQAAMGGKPLFHAGENGGVLDLFGGGLETQNPMAKSSIDLRGAQAGAQRAAAADHYAGAGLKSAQRNEVVNGPKGVLRDTDQGLMLVDPRTGISVPATADGKPLAAKLKDIPAPVNAKIMEGKQGVTNLDDAIASIEQNPGAFGWVNAIPGAQTVRQMTDPEGVTPRAKVANIGSLVLHDRSGAAVSASEFPRLAPFIPSASDRPEAAIAKLRQMKKIAEEELGLYASTYSQDNGYRESPLVRRPAAGSAGPTARPPLESFNR